MDVVLKRGTANAKLTGGKRRNDVWIINPTGQYDTCPTTCPHLPKRFYDAAIEKGLPVAANATNACYANGRTAWAALKGEDTTLHDAINSVIAELPANGLLRWAEVGDIVGSVSEVISELRRVRDERPDITLIAYTHNWRDMDAGEAADIFRASCETILDIAEAETAGWTSAVTSPIEWADNPAAAIAFRRENDLRGTFVCPATTKGSNCADCGACDLTKSTNHVAFPAHGARKDHASLIG